MNTIYEATKKATVAPSTPNPRPPENTTDRWNNILYTKDDKQVWKSINWKGTLDVPGAQAEKPSNADFCTHFEALLNPTDATDPREYTPRHQWYIPILDDPIDVSEVFRCAKKLRPNKAAGSDGIPPGVLKVLPDQWIILLTNIFNLIFLGHYPMNWTMLKVFTIFKNGRRDDPDNYRGISVLSAIPKLYDMVLSQRFSLWYTPRPEQAGGQPGRSCEEQILCVRLLIDIARKTGDTLYIVFIDYRKAYDRVNRLKLVEYLDSKGCGNVFLKALQNSIISSGIIGD